jgi:hypothetical protein
MRAVAFWLAVVQMGLLPACKGGTDAVPDNPFNPAGGFAVMVADSGSADVDALVLDLVSRRPAPYPTPYWDVNLVGRYATPEVEAAIQKLKQMGPSIFPALVKHLRDDRYSYSESTEAWTNFSVRDAVVEILCDRYTMQCGYKARNTPNGSAGALFFEDYLEVRGAEQWAEWAKEKSRLDIQMNFIDWCVEQENKRGYVDEAQKKEVLVRYEGARGRVRKEYSAGDRR